ncbi:Quinidine resistance protein 1 [Fusarium odoratissimum]|uniref:Quinidine resistance protein 1 n=2 Tax=Fusarium oxysporum f. sp. cubense (strain race 4) TaxID=2502994 RepID=N1RZY4_FUSC4|nr:Quinidine resistance protein 1 [Fusarium odoratissimum]
MVVSVSLFALLGTMATSMYYPALPTVPSDLGVSITDVNLSATTFMILQGIAPTFVGNFSDSSGRRLSYIVCFSIFLIANTSLALQNTYAGLLALRCVQSAGAGGLIPLASGVIADIVEPAERNKHQQEVSMELKPMSFSNPFSILKVVLDKEGLVVLAGNGVINILIASVNTGLPPLMTSLAVCTIITGRLMDRAYRKTAAKHSIPLKFARRDPNMPVEHTRLQVTWPHIAATITGLPGYGWTLNKPTHLAGPMLFLFIIGYATTAVAQALNALMVDLFPQDAATASAANNLIRCGLGAVITAAIQPLTHAVQPGWTYAICAGFLLIIVALFIALTRFGPDWRAGRMKRDTTDQGEGRNIVLVI